MKRLIGIARLVFVPFLIVLILMPISASADKLQEILDRGHLIVGSGSTNPPWHFKDDAGKLVGMDIDIARMIAKGLFGDADKVKFVNQSGDSRIPNLVTDKIDIAVQFMTISPERAQQVEFSIPYYREGVGVLMLKKGKYKSLADLRAAGSAVTVSILQNVYAEDLAHQGLPNAKVDQYESQALSYQALNAGQSDAAATDLSSAAWLAKKQPDRYIASKNGWGPQNYGVAIKVGEPRLRNFVNSIIEQGLTGVLFEDMKASYQKWFGITIPTPQIGFPK